jgi:hypothetical protein
MDNGSETLSLVNLTQTLLDAIAKKDWEMYLSLTDEKLSSIEPEFFNSYYEGLEIHRAHFEMPYNDGVSVKENILQPVIKTYGDISIICYKRVQQVIDKNNKEIKLNTYSETRIWKRTENSFKLVHYHRS